MRDKFNKIKDYYHRFVTNKHYSKYNVYNAKDREYESDSTFQFIILQIKQIISLYPDEFNTICEIGSGDGRFLKYI